MIRRPVSDQVMERNEEKDQVEDRFLEPRRSKRQGNVVSYTPKKKHKVVDKPFESVESFVKKNRPRSLTKEEKLDILSVQAKFRHEHAVLHSNKRPGRMKKNADATNRTVNVLGRSNKLCSEIWTKFVETVSIMAQLCPRCNKPVYFAEEVRALSKKWHKLCLKCAKCNKLLDSTTCTDHEDEVYCRACYGKNFGPKGYGFAGGASGLSMDTGNADEITRKNVSHLAEAHAAPLLNNNNSTSKPRWGSSDICPRCNKAVFMAEKVMGAGKTYHKACFKCATCNKSLDSTTLCDKNEQIYCKACYNKQFGPKGFGYGAALQRTT